MRGLWIALVIGCGGGSNNGAAVCGDGDAVEGIEECDDGNLFDGDGCSAQCRDEGCGDGRVQPDEQCDDANDNDLDSCTNDCVRPGGDVARLDAMWSFTALEGMVTEACAPPITTVVVESQGMAGPPFRDMFACAPGSGTAFLPPDLYRVHLDVLDPEDPAKTIAEGLPETVDLTAGDGTYVAEIFLDGGFFDVTWELRDANNGNPLDCVQVGALDHIEVTTNGAGGPVLDLFDCARGHGVTGPLLAGAYQITVRAVTAGGRPLNNDADVSGTILGPNRITPVLGVLTIPE